MKTKFLLLLTIICLTTSNCSINVEDNNPVISCTEEFVYGLSITLTDDSNGNSITEDVVVTATDGTYEETLQYSEGSNTFYGAGEREGNYTITVTSSNYQTYTSEVITVTSNVCHVISQNRELVITPN